MKTKFNIKFMSILLCGAFIFPYNSSYAVEKVNVTNEINNKESVFLTEDDYKTKSATELANLVKDNKIRSEDLVKLSYSIIKKENPELNVVISTREEEALQEAKKLDSLIGEERNKPFFGVPALMKGYGHSVAGQPNTSGYTYNKDSIAKNDSRITKEFKNLGFIILGTTNYPEGAMRNITDSILYGASKNPMNKDYNTGGSSGGSAGAVASGMVSIASGSDIGGSIRIPASWTGLIGLKPTSESGYAVHFPIVKSVTDSEVFFDNTVNFKNELANIDNIKSLKIGYSLKSPEGVTISEDVKKATLQSVEFLKNQGFIVEEIDYPIDAKYMLEKYTNLATAGSKILDKTLAKKGLNKYDVDPLTWALHIYTKELDSKDAKKLKEDATKDLEEQTKLMAEFHKEFPIILTPTTATSAPLNTDYYVSDDMKEILYNFDKVAKEDRYKILVKQWEPMFKRTPFTLISNLTKEPTITLPTYIGENNLPIGVMLNAPKYYDKVLLKFAKFFEDNNMFKMNNVISKNKLESKDKIDSKQEINSKEDNEIVDENINNKKEIEEDKNKNISSKSNENTNKLKNKVISKSTTNNKEIAKKLPQTGIENKVNLLFLSGVISLLALILVKKFNRNL